MLFAYFCKNIYTLKQVKQAGLIFCFIFMALQNLFSQFYLDVIIAISGNIGSNQNC